MPTSRTRSGRPWIRYDVVLGGVSVMFPLAAGLANVDRPPTWIGVLDVVVAQAWVLTMMAIKALAQGRMEVEAQLFNGRAYRWLAPRWLVLLAVFFVMGDRANWGVPRPGLGWRMVTLPAAPFVWRTDP